MTTTIPAKKIGKKSASRKGGYPPLPPTAKVVEVVGRECVIVPLDDYDDWLQDALLTAIAADRLERGGDVIPFEEVEARLDAGKKRR